MTTRYDQTRDTMIYDGPHEAVGDIFSKLQRWVVFDELAPAVAHMLALHAMERGRIERQHERAFMMSVVACMMEAFTLRSRGGVPNAEADVVFGWRQPAPLLPPLVAPPPRYEPEVAEIAKAEPAPKPVRRPKKPLTEQEVAAAAWQWANGVSQLTVAKQHGYTSGSPISVAIQDFLQRHLPDEPRHRWGTLEAFGPARKALVKPALEAYARAGGKLRLRAPAKAEDTGR